MNFTFFKSPIEFQDFATRLFLAERATPDGCLQGYTAVSAELRGDLGLDGYCPDGTVFQMYYAFPGVSSPLLEREKKKILDTLSKLNANAESICRTVGRASSRVVFVINRDPDVELLRYARERSEDRALPVEIWGASKLSNLLSRHRHSVRDLLPSEWIAAADVARLNDEALACVTSGDFDRAMDLCGRALEEAVLLNDPRIEFGARVALATAALDSRSAPSRIEQAMMGVQRCADRQPHDAEVTRKALLITSQWLLRTGRLDETEDRIRTALALAEQSIEPEAMRAPTHLMCWVAISRRDPALLRQFLDRFRAHGGEAVAVAELTAALARLEGDINAAIDAYRRVLDLNVQNGPVSVEYFVRLELANLLADCERYHEAIEACHPSRAIGENDTRGMELALLEGKLRLTTGDRSHALPQLLKLQNRAARSGERRIEAEAALAQCQAYLEGEQFENAVVAASSAREAFAACSAMTGCVEAIRLTAVALDHQKRRSEALNCFRTALQLAGEASAPVEQRAAIRMQIGFLLVRTGRFDEALAILPATDEVGESPPELLGQLEMVRQEASQALEIRTQLLEIVRTDEPLTLAGTRAAASLQDAHRTVLLPLLNWVDAWPDAAPGIIDFWGRGNFAKLALNHRAFEEAFHLTVEVWSLDAARRAIRILSPFCDCLTLLWKGQLIPTLGMVPVHEAYEAAGGWGYAICAGSAYVARPDVPGTWYPAMGVGNYLPRDVAEFVVREIRTFVEAGRVILLPAPLIGCISQEHGALEAMFSSLVHADPILNPTSEGIGTPEPIAMVVPYFENAPLDDLARIIVDEHESLAALRLTLLELSSLHLRDGKDISPTARRLFKEKIRQGIAEVTAKMAKIASGLPGNSGVGHARLASSAVEAPAGAPLTDDEAAKALVALTAGPELRRGPWYAVWRMQEQFAASWRLAGPVLATAGLPGGDDGRGIVLPDTPIARSPEVAAVLAQGMVPREGRRLYHWIHPARGGWTIPTGVRIPL